MGKKENFAWPCKGSVEHVIPFAMVGYAAQSSMSLGYNDRNNNDTLFCILIVALHAYSSFCRRARARSNTQHKNRNSLCQSEKFSNNSSSLSGARRITQTCLVTGSKNALQPSQ